MVMPINILEKAMNKKVSLLLKDNRLLEGKLIGFDEFMNLVLDETEEINNDNRRRLNTVILRGNNVVLTSGMQPAGLGTQIAQSIYQSLDHVNVIR